MTTTRAFIALALIIAAAGCKESTTAPQPEDPWSYPSGGTKFAVTLYAKETTIGVGQTTEVKLVLYNVSNLFGAAAELRLPLDSVQVVSVVRNPNLFPNDQERLVISLTDSTQEKFAYGITLRAGGTAFSGSTVVFKATVKGLIAGPVRIRIVPQTLALVKSDGTPITNFGSIAVEDLTLTVQ